MNQEIPRLRMFAGPNGSGKSTLKSMLRPELIGVYINPDEIEKQIRECGFINFHEYSVEATKEEVINFFDQSSLLKSVELLNSYDQLDFKDEKLFFHDVGVNAYFASVIADFIRSKLIESSISFTFETVMSFPDKIELLRKAQIRGYRTYLYYVATEDPSINISRVNNRAKMGGHPVPEDKIVSRYKRSLDLLLEAVLVADRAYIFDNSAHEHVWVAEITGGQNVVMKTDLVPAWFKKALWNKFQNDPHLC